MTFIFKNLSEHKENFERVNYFLGFERIRILCLSIILFNFYFLYADLTFFKNVDDLIFKKTFISIHIISFVSSVLFLLLYNKIKNKHMNLRFLKFIIRGYVFIFLFIGALSSINSQRLTGNIDAYVVMILISSMAFSLEPLFMFFSLLINHIFFILGISLLNANQYTLVSKQINSTAMVIASFIFSYCLYKYRAVDFINNQKLVESEANFKKLFSVNPLPLFISKYNDGKIIFSNDKAHDFYGYSKEDFLQANLNTLYADKNDIKFMLKELNSSVQIKNYIVEQKSKSNIKKWVIASYELIEYAREKCILTSVTDITELKKMQNQLLNHASTDSLTGVLNRRVGMQMLQERLNSIKLNDKKSTICFIDIDNLKEVNDTYGHNEGDTLINTICTVIKDTINDGDIFFRLGGDEFIILFSEKDAIQSENKWNKIISNYDLLNNNHHKPYSISASHGLFEFDKDTDISIEQIIDLADKKMYIEKNIHRELSSN